MGSDETSDSDMTRPTNCYPSLGTAKAIGDASLATREYERQRPGPMSGREIRGETRQMEIEALDHVASGDEQEKWFRGRPALHFDECVDRIAIDRAAESVHRLRRVGQHATHLKVSQREA
jgi:hypothetical protein